MSAASLPDEAEPPPGDGKIITVSRAASKGKALGEAREAALALSKEYAGSEDFMEPVVFNLIMGLESHAGEEGGPEEGEKIAFPLRKKEKSGNSGLPGPPSFWYIRWFKVFLGTAEVIPKGMPEWLKHSWK